MKRARWGWLGVTALIAAGIAAGVITAPHPPYKANDPRLAGAADAKNGRLVFAAGDCASCHATPGQPDRLRLGGGIALASPYGMFRPPNISPDPQDGIGQWAVHDLANALIGGVSPGGAHYYPAFPYPAYTGMTESDVRDLFAYLRTLQPVSGQAPGHDLAWVFRIRRFVGFWKFLYFHERGTRPAPSGDSERDRGAYLVEAVAHCAECHSSRNIWGAIKPGTRFAGAPDPEGVGFVPNITPARIGTWAQADIAKVLATGQTPDHGRVGSSMVDVVVNTAMLPQSDREAIARYIKSLPSRPTPRP